MMARARSLACAIALSGALVAACDKAEAPRVAAPELVPASDAITKITDHGPVKATMLVWPAKPRLDEPIYLRLSIEAPAGVHVDAPFQEAGDQRLGRFKVVGFVRDVRDAPDGGKKEEQTYTLEAQTSGKYRVPPLRLEMVDARNLSAPKKPEELVTDEVPLEIVPVEAKSRAAELQPALGELDPNEGRLSVIVVVASVGAAGLLGVGAFLFLRKVRARRKLEKQRSAMEDALSALEVLQSRGAPDAGDADAWFVELSAIVRRYLEHRYDIRAPELTTEEFLAVATDRSELRKKHRKLLSTFLERCDRVKFAGYRPDADESLATLAAARAFVAETRVRRTKPKAKRLAKAA